MFIDKVASSRASARDGARGFARTQRRDCDELGLGRRRRRRVRYGLAPRLVPKGDGIQIERRIRKDGDRGLGGNIVAEADDRRRTGARHVVGVGAVARTACEVRRRSRAIVVHRSRAHLHGAGRRQRRDQQSEDCQRGKRASDHDEKRLHERCLRFDPVADGARGVWHAGWAETRRRRRRRMCDRLFGIQEFVFARRRRAPRPQARGSEA